MKKIKLLLPTVGLTTLCAIAPVIASCSCNPTTYFTVKFDANGGYGDYETVSVASGSKLTKPEEPVNYGYAFNGWYKDEACSDLFDFDKDTVTKDMTLYAGWDLDGVNVEKEQWDKAFDVIGDRTQRQVFWLDGGMAYTIYEPGGTKVKSSLKLRDLIVNGSTHWYNAQNTSSTETTDVDVVGEYYSNFYFEGRRETTGEQKTVTYKNTDSTDLTELLEYIRAEGKKASPEVVNDESEIKFKKVGGKYVYYNIGTHITTYSSITFKDSTSGSKLIKDLYYYYYDETDTSKPYEYEYNFAVNYEGKTIELPTNWDQVKYKSHASFSGETYADIQQPTEVKEGFVLGDTHLEGKLIAQTMSKIKFTTGEQKTPYTGFKEGDLIIFVGQPGTDDAIYHTMTASEYASGEWTLPSDVTTRLKETGKRVDMTILFKTLPSETLRVTLE